MANAKERDSRQAAAMKAFRQKGGYVDDSTRTYGGSKGKKGGRMFGRRFNPSEEYLDALILVPGDFKQLVPVGETEVDEIVLPYLQYRQHYDSRHRKFTVCSSGPFRKGPMAKPCLGCYLDKELTQWSDRVVVKRGHVGFARQMTAFSIIHLHPYHKVEVERGGKVYTDWERCRFEDCELCEQDGVETVEFRRLHWSVGPTFLDRLFNHNDNRIACDCGTCGARRSIDWEAWICPNCEAPHIERDVTRLSAKDVEEFSKRPATCSRCGVSEFPKEVVYCEKCKSRGERMSMFDVVLKVQLERSIKGGNTQVNLYVETGDPVFLDGKLVSEFKFLDDELKPLDLASAFAPDSLEDQSKKFEWDIPDDLLEKRDGLPSGRSPTYEKED